MSFFLYVCVSVCLLLHPCISDDGKEWSYSDTKWEGECRSGRNQSPIDLIEGEIDGSIKEISLSHQYYQVPSQLTLVNVGKTVQMQTPKTTMKIYGGVMKSSFTFLQLHFHWGSDDNKGSEHTIDGKAYPLEFHLVHWNSGKYATPTEAMKHKDGIAVLGVFVDATTRGDKGINDELELITLYFDRVRSIGKKVEIPYPFPLSKLLPSDRQYFTYQGSLTTPGCNEIVQWIVFKTPIYITHAKIKEFRNFRDDENSVLENTFRPVQALNNRIVRLSPIYVVLARESTLTWHSSVMKCSEIQDTKDRIVEVLEVVNARKVESLQGFLLKFSSDMQWLIYRQHNKIGMKASPQVKTLPSLEGGGLKHHFHFHDSTFFFNSDKVLFQSPHTINDHKSPLEIHMIFYDKIRHESFSKAHDEGDFVIVVITTKISKQNTTEFSVLDKSLKEFTHERKRMDGDSGRKQHEADQFIALNDVPAYFLSSSKSSLFNNNTSYYKYYGPTTFPHCAPSVQWVVRAEALDITAQTSDILREISLELPYKIMSRNKHEHISEIISYNTPSGVQILKFTYPVLVMMMMMIIMMWC